MLIYAVCCSFAAGGIGMLPFFTQQDFEGRLLCDILPDLHDCRNPTAHTVCHYGWLSCVNFASAYVVPLQRTKRKIVHMHESLH